MPRSGARLLALLLPILLATGCIYGFAGGGLPPNIKTVAVLPFENQTSLAPLQQELNDRMRREVEGRLGLREASEKRADAVVRGKIVNYEPDIPVAYSSDPSRANTAQRKVQITVDVEIVEQATGKTLWSQKGLMRDGTYNEGSEADGRQDAIEKIVEDVIAGAQSQW
ncbi:MAG TPA: LptE family protein [Gemmatimonadaceae bacterium]|nr:LptE family protein [Gemmatimonadaceae bacterium]HEU6450908.1 LptE family protein [Gemmatimonadaceae bacterium]